MSNWARDKAGQGGSAEEHRKVHERSDVDQGVKALHHTLGPGPNQAAPGDHTHEYLTFHRIGDIKMSLCSPGDWSDYWLPCDGSVFDGAVYPDMEAHLGGTTMPDFSDLFFRGEGATAAGILAGSDSFTLTNTNLPPHFHSDGSLSTDLGGAHVHDAGTLETATNGAHRHDLERSDATGTGSSLERGSNAIDLVNNFPLRSEGDHAHDITGSTGSAVHLHDVVGSTGVVGDGTAKTHIPRHVAVRVLMFAGPPVGA